MDIARRTANQLLKPLDNKVVKTTVHVGLILYASLIAPELPDVIARQFDNIVVRAVLIFLIAYLAVKDPVTAGMATLALMVTVLSLHRRDVQRVLGAAATVVDKPSQFVGDALEQAYDVGADVVEAGANVAGKVLGGLGLAPANGGDEKPSAGSPAGVEAGADDAGSV